ncbi:MAG TPA: AIM24 family protein, partial [Patescibacteria group bacterium]|nr:AIM24 family protein [Patescibacteria group bacterium]
MVTCKNLYENKNIEVVEARGDIKVLEFKKDLSISAANAIAAYYASEMNVRKRQVLIELKGNAYTISAGAMQWTSGAVSMVADVKGIGDMFSKALS